ncbi:MAG: glucose-6-phosphate isomerase [Bryobacterales bacterium]|nr:glucose-6-phosphate isomerase [Bryobacterales bacterium]
MAIQFDPANLMDSMIGTGHGISASDVSRHAGPAKDAIRNFHKLVDDGKYGFPHLPFQTKEHKAYLDFAASVRGSFDTVCVVGIGGSALGAWALDCGLRGQHPIQAAFSPENPRLVILDNVDPDFIGGALASMNPKKTLVTVIAKSGATAETVAAFLIVRDWLTQKLGAKKAAQRIVAVTSAGTGDLKVLATKEGYQTFHLPDNVGGRFSVLSAVGLVPAALCGFDIRKLCKGAAAITDQSWKEDLSVNVAANAALHHWLSWTLRAKPIQVAFPYVNRLWGTAFWFRQLWAESLGKKYDRQGNTVHVGQTPIAALGTTDQHSQVQLYMEGPNDKAFTFWTVKKPADVGRIPKTKTGLEAMDYLPGQTLAKLLDAEQRATAAALTEAQRPNSTFTLDRLDAEHLGAFLQLLEFETAFAGELLGIDAFDQPGVELGKRFTFALMGRKGFDEYGDRFKAYEKQRQNR